MAGTEAAPLRSTQQVDGFHSDFFFFFFTSGGGAPFLKQGGWAFLSFCRMHRSLTDYLSALPGRCDANSRFPCPVPLAFSQESEK